MLLLCHWLFHGIGAAIHLGEGREYMTGTAEFLIFSLQQRSVMDQNESFCYLQSGNDYYEVHACNVVL